MQFGFLITAHCNAQCTHCSTNCGPERQEELSTEKICSVMSEAAVLANGRPLRFLLSGGEPFLDFDRLLHIVSYGSGLGATVTCVTNGSWATSPQAARERLEAIKNAGLFHLGLSTSRFHQQFIKRQRIERALNAAREVGLPCTLKYVRTRSDAEDPETLRAWALDAGAAEVQDFAVMPYLREGAQLAADEYPAPQHGLPEGRCPSPLVNIREDGATHSCCTPGAQVDLLALGNVHQANLRDVHGRFYLGGAQQLLRHSGPIVFARAIQEQGLSERLRPAYTSVCDLCVHIANDPEMSAAAKRTVRDYEVRQLRDIIGLNILEETTAQLI